MTDYQRGLLDAAKCYRNRMKWAFGDDESKHPYWIPDVAIEIEALSAQPSADATDYAATEREALPKKSWKCLTDADRQRAFESLPNMLDGFLQHWGWLHFAKAIEDICRQKNPPELLCPQCGADRLKETYREPGLILEWWGGCE